MTGVEISLHEMVAGERSEPLKKVVALDRVFRETPSIKLQSAGPEMLVELNMFERDIVACEYLGTKKNCFVIAVGGGRDAAEGQRERKKKKRKKEEKKNVWNS